MCGHYPDPRSLDLHEMPDGRMPEPYLSSAAYRPQELAASAFSQDLPRKTKQVRCGICIVLFILCVLLSFFLSKPEAYVRTSQMLDQQKDVTLGLVATTTTASLAVSALPSDIGSSIAAQLADLSGKLAVVLAIIYFEKFMMTTLALVGWRILLPAGIALFAYPYFKRREWQQLPGIRNLGIKVAIVGLAPVTIVPASAALSSIINNQYQVLSQAQATETAAGAAGSALQEQQSEDASSGSQDSSSDAQDAGTILDALVGALSSGAEAVSEGVSAVATGATEAVASVGDMLNSLIDTVAVMIVTSCLVPLVVLLFYFWVIRLVTGFDAAGYLGKASHAVSSEVAGAGAAIHQRRAAKQGQGKPSGIQ